MNKNERVILIKGDGSKWYEEAIFIVNKKLPADQIPVDFVAEAERIINQYIAKKSRQEHAKMDGVPRRKHSRYDTILNIIMMLGCIVIAGAFFFGMLNK